MDSITRIKDFIKSNFPNWKREDFSKFREEINFRTDLSDLYRIINDEIILISYVNISITGTDRDKPQLRVFLDEYKKPFYFAKKHQFRYYLFSIFTKDDKMARGLDNFNPKEYVISIETNLDNEASRRDLRSIYDYANRTLNGQKFLKCSRNDYKVDINEASFIYIGTPEKPYTETFENFVNMFDSRPYQTSINNQYILSTPITLNVFKSYFNLLHAIRTKPFLLLAGISGTGKSRIIRELAFKSCPEDLQDKDRTSPGNYCMIEVKPNWHDSTELLGYYSSLSNKYLFKKFTNFLVKAMQHKDVPFFVCLDEMNLAPVEQYFAEFLSVLETRKKTANGIVSGALIEAKYFASLKGLYDGTDPELTNKAKELADDIGLLETNVEVARNLFDNGLTLPDNVIIIGTVNMDDTTHQFSRKVIDRAMTIEMNGGNLRNMFGGSKKLDYLPEEEQSKWQDAFSRIYVSADDVLELHPDVADQLVEKLPARLDDINKALKGTPFEVSYRVLNELTIMVGVMLDDDKDGKDLDIIINQAINNILLMKILPRIEGDEEMFELSDDYKKRMGVSYKNRLEWLKDLAPEIQVPHTNDSSEGYYNLSSDEEAQREYSMSAKDKIQEMEDRLNNQGFTRFWP